MNTIPPLQYVSIHGHKVGFRTAGTGPVVLLVHGMAGSSDTWRYVMPALAAHCTVVAPDLLGHGASAKPRTEYSVSGHANLLRDLMAALGHERATLIGQSLGGGVVMQLAYQFPQRCERLVLVASGGLGREVSSLLRGLSWPGVEHLFPFVCSPALRDAGHRIAAWLARGAIRTTPVVEEVWRSYASLADEDARLAFFQTLRAVVAPDGQSVSATDRLYLAARVPTLIVWGGRDTLIPVDHGVAAHEAIPGSRLEIFEDAGHYPHCEAPERFVRALVDFIHTTMPVAVSEHDFREVLRLRTDTTPASGPNLCEGELP